MAKKNLRDVNSVMTGMGKTVPFTQRERADVVTSMYGLMQRFGPASSFLTMSPDDTNDIIMLRSCFASKSNESFPATSELDYISGKRSFKDVLDEEFVEEKLIDVTINIPIKQHQKNMMAAMNPVAVGNLYRTMQKIFFEELLGVKIENDSNKKTLPRCD